MPFTAVIVHEANKRPDLVGHARVATETCLVRTSMYSAVDDMPILLFQGFPRTLDNLLAEVDGFPGLGVGQIRTRELALEERRIQNVCIGM